jgi:hypothetical protein
MLKLTSRWPKIGADEAHYDENKSESVDTHPTASLSTDLKQHPVNSL